MKKSLGIFYILIIILLFGACGKSAFDGSRKGNNEQFIMEYKMFNTTDAQNLLLESGDIIRTEIVVDSGKLSIKIQKDSDTPVYKSDDIISSDNFDVEIQESGTYTITVTGEKAKGSVSFIKIAKEKDEKKEKKEKQKKVKKETIDLNKAFQGINGCAVIYLPTQERYLFFNKDMCKQKKSPYSTFKIISALSGLQNGVITDETSKIGYDGTVYSNSDWNGSNINPMEKLNGFWLGSSLKISPLEQIKVLEKIFEGKSNYDNKNIEILKNIMLVDESDTQKVYGKTGTGANGEAWFVGFLESGRERKYFAVYLNDSMQKEQVSGNKAKEIALEILK